MTAPPVVLSVAGYDPSSGAGVTADIKTAAAFGCYAVTCITALTVQSTQGVFGVEPVRREIVCQTLVRLRQDFEIAAVRIGMLGSGEVAAELANFLEREQLPNVVLDPVVRSSSGADLIDQAGLETLRRRLLPLASLITPNAVEAARLADTDPPLSGATWREAEPEVRQLADRLHGLGARGVLITGGDLAEPVDFLSVATSHQSAGRRTTEFRGRRIDSPSTHGTGCALATALACLLAQRHDLESAVRLAGAFVRDAIQAAYPLGKGNGPINPLHRLAGPETN
jgi:hydroxymethylpyrimidine/phosphomethylpyrimidine kinase